MRSSPRIASEKASKFIAWLPTAARESGRYALSKVQLQGTAGRVVGTDGKVALLWGGFDFPFADDVLVPALPAFGSKPLARLSEAKVGRIATHLVVAAGPWAVWLPTDAAAKFPDVAGVTPKRPPAVCAVDARDDAQLLRALPGLPGRDHELRPVTLDADGVVRVRGRAGGGASGRIGSRARVPAGCRDRVRIGRPPRASACPRARRRPTG